MRTFVKTLTFACILFLAGYNNISAQSVGINSDNSAADASAILDVKSTTQGVLVPRMTQTQRNAINSPATGLMIFQTDNTPGFYYFNGSAWAAVGGSSTAAYPNVELAVTNTTRQTITALTGDINNTTNTLVLSNSNSANASLTGGNTWDGSVFTVGSTGAGWYQINAQAIGVSNTGGLSSVGILYYLDVNNTVTGKTGSKYISTIYGSGQVNETVLRQASHLNTLIYLNANDNIRLRAFSASNVTAANTSTDGSTYLNIVRVK